MLIDHLSIIGVGLIGGSLARALRKAKLVGRITACNRSEATLKKAIKLGVIDDYSLNISEAVKGADVIIIGTPLSSIIFFAIILFPIILICSGLGPINLILFSWIISANL